MVYLPTYAFETKMRVGIRVGANKSLQEEGVGEPLFLVGAPGVLPANSLSAK